MNLYHILPFHRLVDVFETRELYFSSPKSWEDPYESVVGGDIVNSVFAQCWCKLAVSDAMWRIYSPDRLSVRIKTTSQKLTEEVRGGLKHRGDRYRARRRSVDYRLTRDIPAAVREAQAAFGKDSSTSSALAPLFIKRRAFKHESEYRIVVHDRNPENGQKELRVPVNPHKLILSVFADPRAPDAVVEVFKFFLKEKIQFKGSVAKSALYDQVDPRSGRPRRSHHK